MNYHGKMLSKNISAKKCYGFLKTCMKKLPVDFPVRGPKEFEKKDFRYENKWKGDLESFVGKEIIFYKGEKVYECNYHGGLIK